MTKFDAIIIGSGQAANPLAKKLANKGWKVALIEKLWVGGTCVNVGCTPTKTMIASGRVASLVKRSKEYGIHINGFSVDMEAVVRRKNAVVLASREPSTKSLLETHNLSLIFGTAVFSGPKEITVTRQDGTVESMTAEKIFINTGTHAVVPPITGLDKINYLTSTTIMELLEVPTHLAVIGGSYIALEFGQLFRRLGSEVTIIEGNPHFLQKEDEDIAAKMKEILEEDGIRILTGTHVTEVTGAGKMTRLTLSTADSGAVAGGASTTGLANQNLSTAAASPLLASHVLVAAGRAPNTAGLNTAATGIELDPHGFVKVNDYLETNVAGIYALGDVKGGPAFTHISYNDHIVVYKNLVENAGLSIAGRPPIYCMFTDPELGRIGLTEKEAKEKGLEIKVATMAASHIARAYENSEDRGMLKAIVNAKDKTILGASMLSSNGGELMSVLQMAMVGGITYDILRDMVFAHPTYAEALNNLFAGLGE